MKTIGCLGPQGSYSCLAARELDPQAEIRVYPNFRAVADALKKDEVDEIALPIENTIQGGVLQNMDILAEEEELFAVQEYVLPITHHLVRFADVPLSAVARVFSHEQALGQCAGFLQKYLPQAECCPVSSTALGLEKMSGRTDACIVGMHLCETLGKEYSVYPENIADEKRNFTYFELVKKGEKWLEKPSQYVYFVATLPHRAGSLFALMQAMNGYGVNMTKIESRPIKNSPGEYRFFIEVEGDYASSAVRDMFSNLKKYCLHFKLLGCY